MYALFSMDLIEDYYTTDTFIGIFSSTEKAEAYIEEVKKDYFIGRYEKYLYHKKYDELREVHKEEYDSLDEIYSAMRAEKPKYKGDQKDKAALEAHRQAKITWLEKCAEASHISSKFEYDNIRLPATRYAEENSGVAPDTFIENEKEWYVDRIPEFKYREIQIDPVFKESD